MLFIVDAFQREPRSYCEIFVVGTIDAVLVLRKFLPFGIRHITVLPPFGCFGSREVPFDTPCNQHGE